MASNTSHLRRNSPSGPTARPSHRVFRGVSAFRRVAACRLPCGRSPPLSLQLRRLRCRRRPWDGYPAGTTLAGAGLAPAGTVYLSRRTWPTTPPADHRHPSWGGLSGRIFVRSLSIPGPPGRKINSCQALPLEPSARHQDADTNTCNCARLTLPCDGVTRHSKTAHWPSPRSYEPKTLETSTSPVEPCNWEMSPRPSRTSTGGS